MNWKSSTASCSCHERVLLQCVLLGSMLLENFDTVSFDITQVKLRNACWFYWRICLTARAITIEKSDSLHEAGHIVNEGNNHGLRL
jgi:hypothetical protein